MDLALPGNAGFNLAIQRVYNSSIFPDYNDGGSTALEEDSWAGIGWKLHFGRVLNADSTVGGETQVEMGDGSRHSLYTTTAHPEGWISTSFWLYDKTSHTLKLPNGVIYTFGHSVFLNARLGTVRYVTEVKDAFNNRVTFSYFSPPGPPDGVQQIQQHLSGTVSRTVTFTYDSTYKALETMSYNGRTWQYGHQAAGPPGHSVLTTVQPPLGPAWQYAYGSGLHGELTSVTTPGGGQTTYTYVDATRRASTLTMVTRVVNTSIGSGPDVTSGTWTFAYGLGSNQDTTVVSCPCGTVRYRYQGVGLSGSFNAWSAGLLAEMFLEDNGALVERRAYTYAASDQISPDPAAGEDGVWTDTAIYSARLTQQVVQRGPYIWTTTYNYHLADGKYNDYGRPWSITEVGDLTRITTRTFQYGFTPYIVDRTATEQVQIGSQTVSSSWIYDLSNGFLQEATLIGIRHRYELGAGGNVAAYKDAEDNRTTFLYAWGQVADIATPHTHTTRSINPDGSIASIDNHVAGGVDPTIDYDAAGRLWRIRRTGLNDIVQTYNDVTGRSMTVTRGSTQSTTTTLDGFGRVISTSNSANLKTRTTFDACGRATFQSLPYTTTSEGDHGTTSTFDVFGRPKTVTAPGGRVTTFTYGVTAGITRTDPEGRVTLFHFASFGEPHDGRLISVVDAAGASTQYEYHVAGGLTKVTGPHVMGSGTAPVRSWERNGPGGQVSSETHPESGGMTYTYYLNGNLKTKTDALGVTQFTYNGDSQMLSRNAPGTDDDVTLTYEAGRPKTMTINGVVTTYAYDAFGRNQSRTDNLGAQVYTSTYGYDANENLSSVTYPSGRVVTYEFWPAEDRLKLVKQNSTLFASNFDYDGRGNLKSYQTGPVTHTFTFDLNSHNGLERIQAGSALDLTYSYDDVGNIEGIADTRPGMTQTFTYDVLDRLTGGAGPWGYRTWSYNAEGNRATEGPGGIATYSYDTATRRLSSIGGVHPETFTYSALGQVTGDARGTYAYNQAGLLKTFTGTNLTATYHYDASDLRIKRTVTNGTSNTTSYTTRGVAGQTLSEYEALCGTPVWTRDVIYAAGRLIGAVRAVRQTASVKVTDASMNANEGTGNKNVTLKLTTSDGTPLTCAVTAAYETSTGTAAPGLDFGTQSGTAVFAYGTAHNATRLVTIPIVQDALDEANETFALNISSVIGGTVGTPSRTDLTITDDDATPTLSIADAQVAEGHSGTPNLALTVSLSAVSGQTVQVQFSSSNDTALAGNDYQAVSGTLTIPAGSPSASILVPIFGDGAVEANETFTVTLSAPTNATLADATGVGTILNDDSAINTWGDVYVPRDGAADTSLLNPSTGQWIFKDSNTGAVSSTALFGIVLAYTDLLVSADYNGDGKTDCAAYRPGTGQWFIAPSCQSTGAYTDTWGGDATDVPVPADYDGDGKADQAVYRRGTNFWHIRYSSTGGSYHIEWGWNFTHVIPVPADYDGDGVADIAYYAAFNAGWYILKSSTGTVLTESWGPPGETVIPTPGDYDGDEVTDLAYYRPGDGYWYVRKSTTGTLWSVNGGVAGATGVPVHADYDADGTIDPAAYDPPTRAFYIIRSTTGAGVLIGMSAFSSPGDMPVLRRPQ